MKRLLYYLSPLQFYEHFERKLWKSLAVKCFILFTASHKANSSEQAWVFSHFWRINWRPVTLHVLSFRKPLLRPCSNCLPCCCALENTQWGHGQGLLMFWRWQKDSSGSVPWLNQLAQVSHLWCGLANRQLFLTSEGRLQLCLLLSPIHIVQLSRCVKCPTFFMLPV